MDAEILQSENLAHRRHCEVYKNIRGDSSNLYMALYVLNQWSSCLLGMRVGKETGGKAPLDFEIWWFPINFLIEKCFSLSCQLVKRNFATVATPGKNLPTPMLPGTERAVNLTRRKDKTIYSSLEILPASLQGCFPGLPRAKPCWFAFKSPSKPESYSWQRVWFFFAKVTCLDGTFSHL